jgi:aflatoxin B1 aldehyde reductase
LQLEREETMRTPVPRLYLGTMTFGWSQTSSKVDERVASQMLKLFEAEGGQHVDTARIYAGGKTEPIVGNVIAKGGPVLVATKAHPSQQDGLSPSGIDKQFKASMEALKMDSLEEYYLHQPDPESSLLESLQFLHQLVSDGLVSKIGMSNYHVSEMARAFDLCAENNLTPPTVYQGLYNPLNRLVEDELLPLLKRKNCSFVAYNPLAAGLLTGKHTDQDTDKAMKGRFKKNPNYLPRFYTGPNFEAIELIRKACDNEGITMVEGTYRWLLRHSALGETDGLLLGASSVEQLEQNLKACAAAKDKGPLSADVLAAFEQAWGLTKDGAFPYWRSYSADMPNRENLDQGASYEATKKK